MTLNFSSSCFYFSRVRVPSLRHHIWFYVVMVSWMLTQSSYQLYYILSPIKNVFFIIQLLTCMSNFLFSHVITLHMKPDGLCTCQRARACRLSPWRERFQLELNPKSSFLMQGSKWLSGVLKNSAPFFPQHLQSGGHSEALGRGSSSSRMGRCGGAEDRPTWTAEFDRGAGNREVWPISVVRGQPGSSWSASSGLVSA